MFVRPVRLMVAVLAATLLVPAAGAGAASPSLTLSSSLTLSVPSRVGADAIVAFSADSRYAGENGSQRLTVFAVPPGSRSPATPTPPKNAVVVLRNETVDNHLILNGLAQQLGIPGSWTLCAYLVDASGVTAARTATIRVAGRVGGKRAKDSARPHRRSR